MIKTLTRLVCVSVLLMAASNGIAQSKTAPKSKQAATKKSAKPVVKEEEVNDEKPPEVQELEQTTVPAYQPPALPSIDTVPPPDDELTREIKKLLEVTHSISTAVVVMKEAISSQRKNKDLPIPDAFYDQFEEAIDKGPISKWLEIVVIKIYRQKFTTEEVSQIIKFYETPVGKKMAAEMTPIASASRAEGEKIGRYMAIKIIEGLMKEGKNK